MTSSNVGGEILVTGATGFIGSHLVPALIEQGHHIHTVSRRASASHLPNVVHHPCDITDSKTLGSILRGHDWVAVLHLAGLVSYTSADADILKRINVDATESLVNLIEQHCPQTPLLFCSSVAAVGSNKHNYDPPLTEDVEWDEQAERVGYLRTKRLAEEIVHTAAFAGRIKASIVCPSNVYGARDALKSSRNTQVSAANGKWPIYTHGGVNVVHIDKVVKVFTTLVHISRDDPLWKGERWLVVGENITIRDMLTMCAEYGGNKNAAPWLNLPNWLLWLLCFTGQLLGSRSMTLDRFAVVTKYHWFNGTRADERFGLENVPARQAIRESVEWMRSAGMVK